MPGQSTEIDQTLLDKANAGEAAARFTVGERYAAGAEGTLAMLYVMGQVVAQSDAEAYYWFDLAAAR